jgi:hypothetical protein
MKSWSSSRLICSLVDFSFDNWSPFDLFHFSWANKHVDQIRALVGNGETHQILAN